jgi:hypothetical protein
LGSSEPGEAREECEYGNIAFKRHVVSYMFFSFLLTGRA